MAQSPPPELTLREVLAAAGASLEVQIANQTTRSAAADVISADHAPLPVLSSKLSQIDLQNGLGAGDWLGRKRVDKSLGLDWTWERGDKRGLRTRAAQLTAAATQAEAQEAQLQQMLQAQAVYFDWLAARERLLLMRGIESASQNAAEAARKRLTAGDLSRQDASRIEVDAARVASDRRAAEIELSRINLMLSQIIGRPLAPVAHEEAITWPSLPASTAALAGANLAATVGERADVRAARERKAAAQVAIESAQALQKSDPTFGVSVDHYPGTSTRLVELRVQIPLAWGYRYQGEAARAQSELRQSELTEERVQRDARSEMLRLQHDVIALEQRLQGYEADILPRASEIASQAEFAYSRGALSLTDLLDARRTLRSTQLDALSLRAELAKSRAAWLLRTEPDRLLAGRP